MRGQSKMCNFGVDLNGAQKTEVTLVENDREQSDDDMEIEIIEVEEPEEPVPMQDCCLQVD